MQKSNRNSLAAHLFKSDPMNRIGDPMNVRDRVDANPVLTPDPPERDTNDPEAIVHLKRIAGLLQQLQTLSDKVNQVLGGPAAISEFGLPSGPKAEAVKALRPLVRKTVQALRQEVSAFDKALTKSNKLRKSFEPSVLDNLTKAERLTKALSMGVGFQEAQNDMPADWRPVDFIR